MPFATTTRIEPKENSLIVCADTVTCSSISAMGSGFIMGKACPNSECETPLKPTPQGSIPGLW